MVNVVHLTTVPESLWNFFPGQFKYLKEKGIELTAISSPGEYLRLFADREGISTVGIPMTRKISPVFDLYSLQQLVAHIKRISPQIIHSHTPKAGLLGMLAASICNVPLKIYQVHGFRYFTTKGATRTLLVNTERLACSLATEVWFVSQSVMKVALEEGICPSAKARIVHKGSVNGIDTVGKFNSSNYSDKSREMLRNELGIPLDNKVIGFVGRIVNDKGISELIEAWNLLKQNKGKLTLLLVGPFDDSNAISNRLKTQILQDPNIMCTGNVLDVSKYFSIMDIYTLPSYREGLPVSMLEAMSMSLPVVATNIPGNMDLIQDNENGLLVAPYDFQDLYGRIRFYLENWDTAVKHGEAARLFVSDNYQSDILWEHILRRYNELCDVLH